MYLIFRAVFAAALLASEATAVTTIDVAPGGVAQAVGGRAAAGFVLAARATADNNATAAAAANSPVPEPALWAVMMFGFGAMGLMARRRSRAQTRTA